MTAWLTRSTINEREGRGKLAPPLIRWRCMMFESVPLGIGLGIGFVIGFGIAFIIVLWPVKGE